jgi:signal transduction histidine kinase
MATLENILERIEGKKQNYLEYNFSQIENNALKTFFDLAQEFDGIEDFYRLCVAIPKCFFDLHARLYVVDPRTNELSVAAQTEDTEEWPGTLSASAFVAGEHPFYTEKNSLILPVRGKISLIDQLPFKTKDNILGLLEVYPIGEPGPRKELFFQKYANRIGFNIHNRYLVEKNIEHLRFIRSLVADIEHNIIAPNMVYKLYLRHLRKKIMMNCDIEKAFGRWMAEEGADGEPARHLLAEMGDVNRGLIEELENIEKHYQNMTLFLETLLRQSHFDTGRFTLRRRSCNMNKVIVKPQLERFKDRFREMGIEIAEQASGIPDEEMISVVDIGLMAQVYANLFSNALKYTEEVVTHEGERKKYVAYGRELMRDFFGPGRDGIKFNVFSTGPHIPQGERARIFEDEFRGSNVSEKPGTGHGLSFMRNVVEIHGGVTGYEPTQYGNNIYFILPK